MSRNGNYKSAIDFVPKLELKHIVAYLPHKLNCDVMRPVQNMGAYKWRIRELDAFILHDCRNNLEHIQPILRPMSDLTKDIEYNGKKIIPIIEIIKKVSLIDLSECYFDVFYEDNHYSVNAETADRGRVVDCIYFDGNVFFAENNAGNFSPLNPQLEAYEMLDKFHFDWKYDLIEKGLAIDINSLS